MRVRLDAARTMLRAALDLLDVTTVDTTGAALNLPVRLDHDRATGETRLPRDPRASVGAGNLRD